MGEPIVQVQKLVRFFGRRAALDGVDLSMQPGEIVALVGPNGSGKTTLLKILAGFLRPTDGTVRVLGLDPFRHRPDVMVHARFAFAPPALYSQLTAQETLHALAGITAGGSYRPDSAEIHRALTTVGLADRADDRVRVFSFGMRQRLALAQALLPMPKILVLDEPTDGLDPLAILELRDVLRTLRQRHGVSILLSSHLLIEVEKLVDKLLVLHEGCCLFDGTPTKLLNAGRRLCLMLNGQADAARRAADALSNKGLSARVENDRCVTLPVGSIQLDQATRVMAAAGLSLREFHERRPSLEEVLLERLLHARTHRPTAGAIESDDVGPSLPEIG